MKWFGESWGAPVNEAVHVRTPVGERCMRCDIVVVDGDQGLVIPFLADPGELWVERPWHLDCWYEEMGINSIIRHMSTEKKR